LSSAEPKKAKPVSLPPIQVSAIPPVTASRVASLKSSTSSLTSNSVLSKSTPSRATSQTASSMQKLSDTSLRRHQLPTIAGSPSVSTAAHNASKEPKELPPSTLNNSMSGLSKETPTKIPRIASRSSTVTSPTLKSRRASVQVGVTTPSAAPSPTLGAEPMNEFGVLDSQVSTTKLPTTSRHSLRTSPSTSTNRVSRQLSTQSSVSGSIPRKANRDSMSFSGLRKASTGSVASITTAAGAQETSSASHHRFSAALSPSKGLKLLSPKVSLSTARPSTSSTSQSHRQTMVSPSLSQQSLSTPSPPPGQVDEDELAGDEEMMHYIKRQQAKKLAHGATQEELDELLRFPEPMPPVPPLSPSCKSENPSL
jgi:dual specificity tyrosine-phosphorylation-regulated kinase 2/3/4